MPKQTTNYRLGYYVEGEFTDGTTEARRWDTLDSQLLGLYEVMGNGVISGWAVAAGTGLSATVSSGYGVISFLSCNSADTITIPTLFASSTNYVYAIKTPSTYWDRSIALVTSLTLGGVTDGVLLATVVTSATEVTSVDNSVKTYVGLTNAAQEAVKQHRHIGGDLEPDLVNLATDVQGTLSQSNMPDLDASQVKTGVLDAKRIPKIDHVTGLTDQGVLTHAQLDSIVSSLSHANRKLMGETALVNLLQLILAIKHQWPGIDDYLVNEIAFIPGISPDSLIDVKNTTANVDTRTYAEGGEHKIYGTSAAAYDVHTKTWNTEDEFRSAELLRTIVDGDIIRLQSTSLSAFVDDFESIGDWKTQIIDLSATSGSIQLDATDKTYGTYSAAVNVNPDNAANLAFTMSRNMAPQDWSGYSTLVFYLKADTLEHGDMFFYINDASSGIQNSFTLVLDRNAPTINRDTLTEGWREIAVDISGYQRSAITQIGLFTSAQQGWDPSRPMSFHIDQMYVTSGNRFVSDGYARFVYGNGFPHDFWRIRFDVLTPAGTVIKFRTRVANSTTEFDDSSPVQATWSPYHTTSPFDVDKPAGSLYKYIQIEAFEEADSTRTYSSELHRLHLDMRAVSSEEKFTYDTQEEWESGTLFDVDTTSDPGSISIASVKSVNNVLYGGPNVAVETDQDLNPIFTSYGTSLPISTRQAMLGLPPGFGQASAVRRGTNETVWVADTDNDRVVCIDKSGNLVSGIYGSFIVDPQDPYGVEETGPGSNEDVTDEEEESSSSESDAPLDLLHSIYNPRTHDLYAVFDGNLETVHDPATTFSPSKLFLRAGSHRVYFSSGTAFSLLGIDPAKYDAWKYVTNEFKKQFTFSSHVLVASLSQADASALNSIVDFLTPHVEISSPYERQIVPRGDVTMTLLTPNFKIGGESSDGNKIKVMLDGVLLGYYLTRSVTLPAPSDGEHSVTASLADKNGNIMDGAENSATVKFVVAEGGVISQALIGILSPKQGQSVGSSPVKIAFLSVNHAITPTGTYMKYAIDGGSWIAHRTTDPISVSLTIAGRHTASLMLVDANGDPVSSPYYLSTVSFNYGVSTTAAIELCVDKGMIRGADRSAATECSEKKVSVAAADIVLANLFCPLDLQIVPDASPVINPSGGTTVVAAKLRSPSWTVCLSAGPGKNATSIFGTKYLDGHSVVQLDADGDTIFSNNAAKFAVGKSQAKLSLGSAWKIDDGTVMIADALRRRAIITHTYLNDQSTRIIWEYDSDRVVCDFQPTSFDERRITVEAASTDQDDMYVKTGTTVVWKNDAAVPIRILSGTTTPAAFAADPDLTLYGDEFDSGEIQPGEEYALNTEELGDFGWFAYPMIVTGVLHVTAAGVSDTDQYLVVEKEDQGSEFGSRVARLDAWGNVVWTFGDGFLSDPRDARQLAGGSIMVSV